MASSLSIACVGLTALTSISCASAAGSVSYETIHSEVEGRAMPYSVYSPPGWDGDSPLPLVVFLHGAGSDESVVEKKAAIMRTLGEWIEAGRLDPFIMVAPDGEWGFWANWHDGSHRYEDYVIDEIIPEIYARYPIEPGREHLHLMGVSMGGVGAMYMALHHSDRFGSVTVLSAPLFDVDQTMRFLDGKILPTVPAERIFGPPDRDWVEDNNVFERLQSTEDLGGTQLLLGVGRTDILGLLASNRELHEQLESKDIPHHYLEYRGGHGWRWWSQLLPVALCLHMRREGCTLEDDRFYELSRDHG